MGLGARNRDKADSPALDDGVLQEAGAPDQKIRLASTSQGLEPGPDQPHTSLRLKERSKPTHNVLDAPARRRLEADARDLAEAPDRLVTHLCATVASFEAQLFHLNARLANRICWASAKQVKYVG